ncbi:hypothetical protein GN956_G1017 [Arapaima gigas]
MLWEEKNKYLKIHFNADSLFLKICQILQTYLSPKSPRKQCHCCTKSSSTVLGDIRSGEWQHVKNVT